MMEHFEPTESHTKGQEVLIDIKGMTRIFRPSKMVEVQALRGVDLRVRYGEFLAITGHSGSGKSTLLNIMGLIDFQTGGTFTMKDTNMNTLNESGRTRFRLQYISFVFQFFNLIENLSALENIIFQLRLQGYGGGGSKKKAIRILEFLGVADKAKLYPRELSGGEQQRIAIGRAIAKDSLILLADEPTAHLDSKNAQVIIDLLREVNKEYKRTVVMITHEMEQAQQADRNIVLKDGRIVDIVKHV